MVEKRRSPPAVESDDTAQRKKLHREDGDDTGNSNASSSSSVAHTAAAAAVPVSVWSQDSVDMEEADGATDVSMTLSTQDESMNPCSEELMAVDYEQAVDKQDTGGAGHANGDGGGDEQQRVDADIKLDETAIDDDLEIPQTPPPVSHATILARSPARSMQLDPSGSAKMFHAGSSNNNNATTSMITSIPRAPSCPTVTFRNAFPLLTDQVRIQTANQTDTLGKEWRVLWYPHGHFMDDEVVSIFVEMVVANDEQQPQEDEENADTTTTTIPSDTVETGAGSTRFVAVEIILLSQSGDPSRHRRQISEVHRFSPKSHEFGMSKFFARKDLLNSENEFLTADGNVEIEMNLHTVDGADGDDDEGVASDSSTTAIYPPTSPSLSNIDALGVANDDTLTSQYLSYDSKTETGMVGLKNQGATCYMNSLLQTLFHLRAFRHVVYETPSEKEDTNDSVSLALQRVFYRLQTKNKAVSTKELTRSFGWSQIDSFMQHDVQELYRILCDRLEEKMKNTKVDSAIKRLFEGKVRSFVQCVNVDFQSFRDESFYDLQLDVKGCRDIYESFRKYVEIEMLQGDNQYEAEGHGKQDAKKGIRFLQLPPVLNIQLKRFEYDPMRDGMVKIHDRFEYPKTLVLDDFISNNEDNGPVQTGDEQEASADKASVAPRKSHVYHLHSVLVHSGDVHGGHYFVFIRPEKDVAKCTNWYRFDDDQISVVDEQTAIEGNYGSVSSSSASLGVDSRPSTPLYSSMLCSPEKSSNTGNSVDFRSAADVIPDDDRTDEVYDYSRNNNGSGELPGTNSSNSLMLPLRGSFSSAYMLVYVRDGENDIQSIAEETEGEAEEKVTEVKTISPDAEDTELVIPEPLLQRFHEEEKAGARRKKMQQTEHLYMTLRIASDTSVSRLKKITKTIDFSSFGNNACLRIRIKRAASIRQLYQRIFKKTGVPVARQRLWKVITRENRTQRPDSLVDADLVECIERLIDDDASSKAPVKLFLQIVGDQESNGDGEALTAIEAKVLKGKRKKSVVHRHLWSEFTPPEAPPAHERTEGVAADEMMMVDEDDDDELPPDSMIATANAPPLLNSHEILLFIKFYDMTKKLGERLEYMGNIVIDARYTGAELAKCLHEALQIPFTQQLVLYEEIQPLSISEIEMDTSLETAEIQNGDIVCYQFANDDGEDDADSSDSTAEDGSQEKYPDVPLYFQYLLDRVEVVFNRYRFPEEEAFSLSLLNSNSYDDIVGAVAAHLGFAGDRKMLLRLYQHSPLTNQPKKSPLRHAKYSGNDRVTLDELLTEYLERANVLYYEVLDHPITEIEAKKQVAVYFSVYDAPPAAFVDAASPRTARRVEFLVLPDTTVRDLLVQLRQACEVPSETVLRVCEASHGGTMLQCVLQEDTPLEKFWLSTSSSNGNSYASSEVTLFVEQVPKEEQEEREIVATTTSADANVVETEDEDEENEVVRMGVVHFSFQANTHVYIHTHGVPLVVQFRLRETVRQVKERIRKRYDLCCCVLLCVLVVVMWNSNNFVVV